MVKGLKGTQVPIKDKNDQKNRNEEIRSDRKSRLHYH